MPEQLRLSLPAAQHSAGKSGFWFITVGLGASLMHALVFALLRGHLLAELANTSGFLVAFLVSFAGHRLLSFRDAGTTLGQSFLRFAVTAVAGFACNALVFSSLLRLLACPDWFALGSAIVIAALQTFVLSRFWAFRR